MQQYYVFCPNASDWHFGTAILFLLKRSQNVQTPKNRVPHPTSVSSVLIDLYAGTNLLFVEDDFCIAPLSDRPCLQATAWRERWKRHVLEYCRINRSEILLHLSYASANPSHHPNHTHLPVPMICTSSPKDLPRDPLQTPDQYSL